MGAGATRKIAIGFSHTRTRPLSSAGLKTGSAAPVSCANYRSSGVFKKTNIEIIPHFFCALNEILAHSAQRMGLSHQVLTIIYDVL